MTPEGSLDRLIPFDPPGAEPGRGLCLEPHDLAAAKLAAGRTKDFEFVGALLDAALIDLDVLKARVANLPRSGVNPAVLRRAGAWLNARIGKPST